MSIGVPRHRDEGPRRGRHPSRARAQAWTAEEAGLEAALHKATLAHDVAKVEVAQVGKLRSEMAHDSPVSTDRKARWGRHTEAMRRVNAA